MADPLLEFLKLDFPQYSESGKAYRTSLEYIGLYDSLEAGKPTIGDSSTDYGAYTGNVSSVRLVPIEGTDHGELYVDFEYDFESAESGITSGDVTKKTYEVEWVSIGRSMYEHPSFRLFGNGQYQLGEGDISDIECWKNEQNSAKKAIYQFQPDITNTPGYYSELSENAIVFAKGVLLGIETWDDFAPVVRLTTGLINGGSESSTAGKKEDPPNFNGKPEGYEWRKSADRSVRAGKGNRWDKVEEWLGTEKVLVDSKNIFYL